MSQILRIKIWGPLLLPSLMPEFIYGTHSKNKSDSDILKFASHFLLNRNLRLADVLLYTWTILLIVSYLHTHFIQFYFLCATVTGLVLAVQKSIAFYNKVSQIEDGTPNFSIISFYCCISVVCQFKKTKELSWWLD